MTLLKNKKIEFYIAPYEADAQLAYLYKTNRVQLVITEDSDLLVFGVNKCFYKMDNEGNGIEINLNKLDKVTELDFSNFKNDMFLKTCIMSGCDYL